MSVFKEDMGPLLYKLLEGQNYMKNEMMIMKGTLEKYEKFSKAPMGVLAPGSAHARPSAQTLIDMSRNLPALMSAESTSNIFPHPSKFRIPRTTFENTLLCPPKYRIVRGVGEVPDCF